MMEFRKPDNPVSTTLDAAIRCEFNSPGEYCCEPKGDGWRRPVYKVKGKWIPFSKYESGPQAARQPPEQVMKQLDSLHFPDGTAFDAEWMGPRAVAATGGAHWLVVYDLLYYGEQWQGDTPYRERKAAMRTLIELHRNRTGQAAQLIQVVPYVTEGFRECYVEQTTNPLTEGIVLKRWDSKLIGGGMGDNPAWKKIKYRQ